jgi:hypothetical protein
VRVDGYRADTRVGAFLSIKEYPTPTQPGMYNLLLRSISVRANAVVYLPAEGDRPALLARQ